MKKLKVLFLSLLALTTIVSCSKDDDNDSSTSELIEGIWQLTKEGETVKTLEAVENEGNCGTTTVVFKSDKTFTITNYYFFETCQQYRGSGTWEKTGNTLKITDEEGEISQTSIVELTASTLIVDDSDEEGTWFELYERK